MTKTMLVTGASSGIGRTVAEAAMDAGWNVGLFARRPGALAEVAEGRDNAMVLPGDVTSYDAVEGAVAKLAEGWGRLDVVFNNAGIFIPPAPIDEIPLEDWHKSVDVNLTGMFYTARASFAQMRRQDPQGGRIINNGSISAHVPRPGSIGYTATKHAITGMTRTLSLDGRAFNIACGQIDIGNARTPMVEAQAARAAAAGEPEPDSMGVSNVSDGVLYMANMPAEANVQFMTVMATKMPYIGRG